MTWLIILVQNTKFFIQRLPEVWNFLSLASPKDRTFQHRTHSCFFKPMSFSLSEYLSFNNFKVINSPNFKFPNSEISQLSYLCRLSKWLSLIVALYLTG